MITAKDAGSAAGTVVQMYYTPSETYTYCVLSLTFSLTSSLTFSLARVLYLSISLTHSFSPITKYVSFWNGRSGGMAQWVCCVAVALLMQLQDLGCWLKEGKGDHRHAWIGIQVERPVYQWTTAAYQIATQPITDTSHYLLSISCDALSIDHLYWSSYISMAIHFILLLSLYEQHYFFSL